MEYVLITGATSGIGLELTKIFAKTNHNLILVARNEHRLIEIQKKIQRKKSVEVEIFPMDLSVCDAPERLYLWAEERGLEVSILINNAGFATYGQFVDTDATEELNLIDLNIRALTHLTKLFLPDMVKRNSGRILNVSSLAAFQPGPLMACYYASKAYVLSISEALAYELKDTGVTVTALCPGPTDTPFKERAGVENTRVFKHGVKSAKFVAKSGYKALMKGKTVVVPGTINLITSKVARIVPRKVATSSAYKIQKFME